LAIFKVIVGVRKKLGFELFGVLRQRCDGTREFVIQKHSPAASDVWGDGVEYFSVGLVFVETVIDKVAKKSATLRTSPAVGIANPDDFVSPSLVLPPRRGEIEAGGLLSCDQGIRFAFRIFHLVTQGRNQVAHNGKSQPQNQWIFCRINKLVDMAGFETGAKIEIFRAFANGFSIRPPILLACGKFPLRVVDGDAGAVAFLSERESGQRFVEGCRCVTFYPFIATERL